MSSEKSSFKKIFGDEIGEILQVMFGVGAMIGLFMGDPFYSINVHLVLKIKNIRN